MSVKIINKIADFQDMHQLARRALAYRLLMLQSRVEKTGFAYSSHMQGSWLRLWEYSSAIIESGVDSRMRVLDAGGTGTIFSYYLASEGCEVFSVDIDKKKVIDANKLAKFWKYKMVNLCESITDLSFKDDVFDRVFSICVIEHLSLEDQPKAIRELVRVLKKDGMLVLSFDFGKNGADNPILSKDEVFSRIIEPSGLEVLNNWEFSTDVLDYGDSSPDRTFGIVFLKKPGENNLPRFREIYLHPLSERKFDGYEASCPLLDLFPFRGNVMWRAIYKIYRCFNALLEERIRVIR